MHFKIDKNKCIHCGQCIKDCVSKIIEFDEEKIPYITNENKCIKCQHCLAICPTGALSVLHKNPDNSEPVSEFPDEAKLLNLIKARRSYRQYKPENIPKDILEKLKNMLKYPPTGCNYHKLHISIIDDIEVMDSFRNLTLDKIKKICKKAKHGPFTAYKDAFLNDEDIVFRDAPHMIVISSPLTAPCTNVDPIITLSNFELYAQALGVGTLWCGYAQICLKLFPDLCEFLEIPSGYKPVYAMLFGMPDIKYARCTQPEEYTVISPKNKSKIKMTVFDKIKRYFFNFIR